MVHAYSRKLPHYLVEPSADKQLPDGWVDNSGPTLIDLSLLAASANEQGKRRQPL